VTVAARSVQAAELDVPDDADEVRVRQLRAAE
jgi:hypothetical protein